MFNKNKFRLEVQMFFDSAHRLPDSENLITKKCASLHGHTYHCKVSFESKRNDRSGMVVDFKGIKTIVDELDHKFINDLFEQWNLEMSTTAENIAKVIHSLVSAKYPDLQNVVVELCEGFKGRENSSYVIYGNE